MVKVTHILNNTALLRVTSPVKKCFSHSKNNTLMIAPYVFLMKI